MIYADHCATTPCLPEAIAAVGEALAAGLGNPAARQHLPGRSALGLLDRSRVEVAQVLGVRAEEILFTSGATEACNLAIHGVTTRLLGARPRICTLAVEHSAVLAPVDRLASHGAEVVRIPVHANGTVDLDAAAQLIDQRTSLVCAMLVNNQSGEIHDVAALADLAQMNGALLLCDATQAPARIAVDLPELGVDLAALSAHKLYGPPGVGALWLRRGLSLDPLMLGGGQERGLRPGTPNLPAIAGFAVAARVAKERISQRHAHLETLTIVLEERLRSALPDLTIHGTHRAPGISLLTLPGLRHGWLAQLANVAASAGSACASGSDGPSHVLTALGIPSDDARNSLRISLGEGTTRDEVEQIAEAVILGAQRLAALSPAVGIHRA